LYCVVGGLSTLRFKNIEISTLYQLDKISRKIPPRPWCHDLSHETIKLLLCEMRNLNSPDTFSVKKKSFLNDWRVSIDFLSRMNQILPKFLFAFFPRFELRGLLSLWNTMLAMFSIMGAFRTAPELIHVLRNYGLFHSVCVPR
jgi:GNS1/SUR4 family